MSYVTLTISLSSILSIKPMEILEILHREGKVTEKMIIKLAPFLGANGLNALDYFIRDAFPIVDNVLWVQENDKGNYRGEGECPHFEGEFTYEAPLTWWIGTVPPSVLLEEITTWEYPEECTQCLMHRDLQDEALWNYLEVLEGVIKVTRDYHKNLVQEEITEVEERLQAVEDFRSNPPTRSWWPKKW